MFIGEYVYAYKEFVIVLTTLSNNAHDASRHSPCYRCQSLALVGGASAWANQILFPSTFVFLDVFFDTAEPDACCFDCSPITSEQNTTCLLFLSLQYFDIYV